MIEVRWQTALLVLMWAGIIYVLAVRTRPGRVPRLERVRGVFERYPGVPLYALDVAEMARCALGSIYPELVRLEQAGVLVSGWEPTSNPEHPRRRVYWLPAPPRVLPQPDVRGVSNG
jgi:hypothetical protein